MIGARVLPLALALSLSCAPASPRDALAEYREALAARDAARIWALSDASFRASCSVDELRTLLAEDPRALEAALARAGAEPSSTRQTAELAVAGGGRVLLVLEDGAWRVADGGVAPERFDTPERALQSFFRAIDGGRWSIVRRAIPRRHAAAFGSDAALAAHVDSMRERIERARAALSDPAVTVAAIDGDRAELPYDQTRRVTFEREDGGWRIVDLE